MKKQWLGLVFCSFLFLLIGCNGDQALDADNDGVIEGDRVRYGQISSEVTDLSSEDFPHTKAVQIQHAKYDFTVSNDESNEITVQLPDRQIQLTKEQIAQRLPGNISARIPEGGKNLTPEDIARLLPERLSTEEITTRLRQNRTQPEETVQQPQEQQRDEQAAEQPQQEQVEQTPTETEQAPEQQQGEGQEISGIERQVIDLTNAERRRNGLSDLQADTSLSHVARQKSKDMQANNYFSHTSPTYGSPFDMMRDFGIEYRGAAENIAQGQRSAEEVVQAWMNSEGHRANIMNGNFTHIGVGYTENGHYWTQMFITK
ncbi:CAP domain-containing protein [Alkalihalobacillus sp. LMS39]|uniref:CAP domain-containing protein n=1 Tax=Alkalihalobacillus sp. LMS39 TaxID=2924032 RepID=UPI0032618ADE